MTKLLRCLRVDASDERVFPRAAAPGEWAIPGAFAFADAEPGEMTRQQRQAFANGFLGLESFGWSTLVTVAEITPERLDQLIEALAERLLNEFGAPSRAEAVAAAREEIDFAASLCHHPLNTLLALERTFDDDIIREKFRVVEPPRDKPHARIWNIVADDDKN